MNIQKNILVLFFISFFLCHSQHKEKKVSLSQFIISNTKLKTILNSVINQEKKCDYYTSDLIFGITIKRDKESISLLIDSFLDKNIGLGLNPYGYFCYKKHLFLIDGEISNQLLNKVKRKKEFKYLEIDPTYQPKNNEKIKIFIYTDDSFSQWEFLYKNQKFRLKNKTSFCR